MAKHLVKCFYCGETFDTNNEPFVKPRANRYAHKACAEKHKTEVSQEELDKEILEQYIKELLKIKSITPKIKKQIELYHTENEYTYSGIYKTLKYFYEIKGNSTEKANGGIGIVPYVYEQAKVYFRALWEAQQQNQDVEVSEYVLPVREIHISPPKREPMKRMRKLFTFLDEGV